MSFYIYVIVHTTSDWFATTPGLSHPQFLTLAIHNFLS